jgi:hypothetical protein
MAMTLSLPWSEIALRLALTIFVGIVIGYNRSQHGKAAGMRTRSICGPFRARSARVREYGCLCRPSLTCRPAEERQKSEPWGC